jgi:PPOX class probable F420-dependent enzyme
MTAACARHQEVPPSSFGGDDVATIPASHADLLKKVAFANLATLNADGSPQVTPVWVDFDGTHVIVNTAKGRVKTKNLARNPRVALSIGDPENPYRYLGIQGRVTEMTETGGDAHIDKMAKKYLGKDTYPFRQPGEVRVIVKIAPDKVHTNG